ARGIAGLGFVRSKRDRSGGIECRVVALGEAAPHALERNVSDGRIREIATLGRAHVTRYDRIGVANGGAEGAKDDGAIRLGERVDLLDPDWNRKIAVEARGVDQEADDGGVAFGLAKLGHETTTEIGPRLRAPRLMAGEDVGRRVRDRSNPGEIRFVPGEERRALAKVPARFHDADERPRADALFVLVAA